MESWSEDPPGALSSIRWGLCQPAQMGMGNATWQLAKIRLLRVFLPIRAKNELSFCRKNGVKIFFFFLLLIKSSQLSLVCIGLDTLWTVQGEFKILIWYPDICVACVNHYCFGVRETLSQICSNFSPLSCHNKWFSLLSWFSSIYSGFLTYILIGLHASFIS